MTTRILEIGHEPDASRRAVNADIEFADIEDKQIITCDIDPKTWPDILHDIREPFAKEYHAAYDIILCSHVLEHIEYRKVVATFENILRCLKVGGEIIVIVPSLEWGCDAFRDGEIGSYTFQALLFGGQGDPHDYHKSAFTLAWFVALGKEFGFEPVKTGYATFSISQELFYDDGTSENKIIECKQNVYIGKKVK